MEGLESGEIWVNWGQDEAEPVAAGSQGRGSDTQCCTKSTSVIAREVQSTELCRL